MITQFILSVIGHVCLTGGGHDYCSLYDMLTDVNICYVTHVYWCGYKLWFRLDYIDIYTFIIVRYY